MSAIAVPEKWVSALDEKKFANIARFELHYKLGSAAYAELPVGAPLSCSADGLITAPTLSPHPLTVREFLGRVYGLGTDHFLADQTDDGAHPKAADLRLVLLDGRDKTVGEVSKKLRRPQSVLLADDHRLELVNDSANILGQTVRQLGSHVVSITSVEARARNDYESIMCTQMKSVSEAWQEVNKDREKISIDLVEAAEAKVRAEEAAKRMDLERQLADNKGFMDTSFGEKLGTVLVTGVVPKLLVFVDGLLATAAVSLEKRKMKAGAELKKFKRELEAEDKRELEAGDEIRDRLEKTSSEAPSR
jgi:hypothetical protein